MCTPAELAFQVIRLCPRETLFKLTLFKLQIRVRDSLLFRALLNSLRTFWNCFVASLSA